MGAVMFDNVINNKELKEQIGDSVLSLLSNNHLISLENDAKGIEIKFGYLLLPKGDNKPVSLLKVTVPGGLFKTSKIFYIAIQKGEMMILDEKFNDELFNKVLSDMLKLNSIDE